MVFEHHVRGSGFNLTFDNGLPKFLSFYGLVASTFLFILSIEFFKCISVAFVQTWRSIWTEESPVPILDNSLHKEVTDPESVEQISGSVFFLTVILLELQEVKYVSVPWLQVNSERSLSFAAALIDISGSLVEDFEHGEQAIGDSVGALNICSSCSDVVDTKTNPTSCLGYQSSLVESLVDAIN